MIDSPAEIVRSYRMAADPKKQIKVLAELNACSVKEIRQVLVGEGVLPRETEIPGEPKKARKPRMKKQVDAPDMKPSEAAPDVQKIPVVGEAVEVTEPDFTKNAAPEPRTVTVEELRALLEDACRDGLGECAVLVEGTAFADLWLDVHSTLRIYESGERTVELKGTAKSA